MIQKPYFTYKYYKSSEEALYIALNTAPLYHSWKDLDPGISFHVDERYSAFPVLTKEKIRAHSPSGLIPNKLILEDGLQRNEIELVHTSGTTSEKITNIWNQSWWNASEAASWKLNAHTAHLDHSLREAQLASALSVGFRSETELPMESRILNDHYLFLNERISAKDLNDSIYERMAKELTKFEPAILEVNPSYLARFAWWAIDNDKIIYQPQVILFTYEFISAIHLSSISKIFHVPLISSYGCTEAGYLFMQCEHGTYHQNTDFCRIDFEPLKGIHSGSVKGRILATTFHNPWVSLIKFDTGDIGCLKKDSTCSCGRNEGYMFSAIEGRTANMTLTTSGQLITTKQVDDMLSVIDGIRDYELNQNSLDNFIMKIVTIGNENFTKKHADEIIHEIYGKDISLIIHICDDIEPGPSGKYRRTHADFDIEKYLSLKEKN